MGDLVVWKCFADGSGRSPLYVSSSGEKTRQEPENFEFEYLYNGDRKYYYVRSNRSVDYGDDSGKWNKSGPCIRCRQPFVPIVLSRGDFEEVFCFNFCERCLLKATGDLKVLSGGGNTIWESLKDEPKTGMLEIKQLALHPGRELPIYSRFLAAKLYVMRGKKHRRNKDRHIVCMNLALGFEGMEPLNPMNYDKTKRRGEYLSWGFDETFDEYFGETVGDEGTEYILPKSVPNGMGVKFYSGDELIYHSQKYFLCG